MYRSSILNPKTKIRLKSLVRIIVILFFLFISLYITSKYIEFDPNLNFENTSSKVYDSNGTLLWEISENNSVRRTPIPLSQVPQYCINAIVAVEDKSFWYNIGVDERGLARLILSLFSGGRFGGGSTISQQLIKNSNDRILQRDITDKLTEIIQAIKLNSVVSKEEILESYLNNIYFGNLNYGIEAAANEYFGKTTRDLDQIECAYLMGIPQRPGIFNPYANLALGLERKDRVLLELFRSNYISEQEFFGLTKRELIFSNQSNTIKAPHYIDFFKSQLKKLAANENDIYRDKEFFTSYDYQLHSRTLNIARAVIEKNNDVNNAAVIVIDSYGDLKVMLGSVDFFNDDISGKFNSSLGLRQPSMLWAPIYISFLETLGISLDQNYDNYSFSYTRRLKFGEPFQTNSVQPKFSNFTSLTLKQALEKSEPIPITNSIDEEFLLEFLRSDMFINNLSEIELDSLVSRCDKYLLLEGCELSLFDLARIYWSFLTSQTTGSTAEMLLKSQQKASQKLDLTEYSSKDIHNKDYFALKSNGQYLFLVWVGNTDGSTFKATSTELNPALEIAKQLVP